jgi:hypothetical protein
VTETAEVEATKTVVNRVEGKFAMKPKPQGGYPAAIKGTPTNVRRAAGK